MSNRLDCTVFQLFSQVYCSFGFKTTRLTACAFLTKLDIKVTLPGMTTGVLLK